MGLGQENHDVWREKQFLSYLCRISFVSLSHLFRTFVVNMYILFYVLSAVNSAIVNNDMFQKWLQLPTGGKVAEHKGL